MLVIIYNFYFLGEPIEVDIRRYWAVPQYRIPMYGSRKLEGREHVHKVNKPKLDTDSPKCVLVVESSQLKLFSVEIKSKHNRVFVCSQAQILFVTPKMQQKEGSSCC